MIKKKILFINPFIIRHTLILLQLQIVKTPLGRTRNMT